MNHFDPDTGELNLILPVPPPDNHTTYGGPYGRYPKPAYKDWLRIVAPLLRETLGDWQPDTARWWQVSGELLLGARPGDGPNYLKPILDALAGAYLDEETGAVRKRGGLFDDDRRVQLGRWEVIWVKHPEPQIRLRVVPADTCGVDWQQVTAHLARAAREARRDRLAAERAEEKERKAAARAAAREARTARSQSAPPAKAVI